MVTLRAGLVLLTLGYSLAATVIELDPNDGPVSISSTDYPQQVLANSKQSWDITAPPGSRIQFKCIDIRLYQDNPPGCDEDLFTVDDGIKTHELCGERYDFSTLTSDNKLRITLKIGKDNSGGISCSAKVYKSSETTRAPVGTQPPSEDRINLQPGGAAHTFTSLNYPLQPPDYTDQEWHFATKTGSTIRVTCSDIRLLQETSGKCVDEILTVTDGVNTKEMCGIKSGFTMLSSGNKMSVRFKTGKYGRGAFKCQAQARIMDWYGEMTTTTTAVPPFRDIPSEEVDSDEHGGPPGSKSTTCNCGWANKDQRRIVNGVETAVNEFPFMAAIIDRISRFQFCGGSIITPYHALTAAHCTARYVFNGYPISIVIGEHNLFTYEETSATKIIDVATIIQHSNFNWRTLKDDISLLFLAEKIEFNQFVGPVCISPVQLEIPRQYVKIIGWGKLVWQGPSPQALQKVNVRVLHRNSCNRVFPTVAEVNPTQICTYASQKASCQGDSGGPVVWLDPETNRYVQVGLVSFGTICADRNPTVHTDVPAYYNWIRANIEAYSYTTEGMCTKAG